MTVLELAEKIVNGCIEHEQKCDCDGHKSGEIPRLTEAEQAALRTIFGTEQMFSITMAVVARICALDPRTALTFAQDMSQVSFRAMEAKMAADGADEIPEPQGTA